MKVMEVVKIDDDKLSPTENFLAIKEKMELLREQLDIFQMKYFDMFELGKKKYNLVPKNVDKTFEIRPLEMEGNLDYYKRREFHANEIEKRGYVANWDFSGAEDGFPDVRGFFEITDPNKEFLKDYQRLMVKGRRIKEQVWRVSHLLRAAHKEYIAIRNTENNKHVTEWRAKGLK